MATRSSGTCTKRGRSQRKTTNDFQACKLCQKRKCRCTGEPICSQCKEVGSTCEYEDSQRKRGAADQAQTTAGQARAATDQMRIVAGQIQDVRDQVRIVTDQVQTTEDKLRTITDLLHPTALQYATLDMKLNLILSLLDRCALFLVHPIQNQQ